MVTLARRAQRTPFAPVVAGMFAGVAAILLAAMPVWMFERAVMASGLPALLPFASPPLGLTARLLGIALAFAVTGGVLWLMLTPVARLLERDRRRRTPWHDEGYAEAATVMPGVEGRRRPIFAPAELGAPLMSDAAIAAPVMEPDPELEAPVAAEELAAPVTAANDDTIAGMLRRLEDGLAKRGGTAPDPDAPAPAPLPLSPEWIIGESHESHAENSENAELSEDFPPISGARWMVGAR